MHPAQKKVCPATPARLAIAACMLALPVLAAAAAKPLRAGPADPQWRLQAYERQLEMKKTALTRK